MRRYSSRIAGLFLWLILCSNSYAQQNDFEARKALGRAGAYLSTCPLLYPNTKFSEKLSELYERNALELADSIYISEQRMLLARLSGFTLDEICNQGEAEFGASSSMAWLERTYATVPYPVERAMALTNRENPLGSFRELVRNVAGIGFYLNACPKLEITPRFVSFLSEKGTRIEDITHGQFAGAYFTELLVLVRWQTVIGDQPTALCGAALRQYGPGGSELEGMIRTKAR